MSGKRQQPLVRWWWKKESSEGELTVSPAAVALMGFLVLAAMAASGKVDASVLANIVEAIVRRFGGG